MDLCEFVCDSVRNICSGRCSTICSEYDSVFEVDSHNGRSQVDLARLQVAHINMDAIFTKHTRPGSDHFEEVAKGLVEFQQAKEALFRLANEEQSMGVVNGPKRTERWDFGSRWYRRKAAKETRIFRSATQLARAQAFCYRSLG